MKTQLTTSPAEAAAFIRNGGLVAFPTETVYGLGADVFNPAAVAGIFEAKMRPADNPLIAHIGNLDQISLLAREVTPAARDFIAAFFPGPLTLVLRKAAAVPLAATAGLGTIGVRMPAHPLAHRFLIECGTPVVAPSANLSGKPSPTSWQSVFEDLDGRIDCILQGDTTDIGLESTVVDCTSPDPLILRSGAVTAEQLRAVVPGTRIYAVGPDEPARSPGLRHRHYSPSARVVIGMPQTPDPEAAYIGISEPAGPVGLGNVCRDAEEYAKELFAFFRECDRRGIATVYCEPVDESGLGAALMDRIRRAAE